MSTSLKAATTSPDSVPAAAADETRVLDIERAGNGARVARVALLAFTDAAMLSLALAFAYAVWALPVKGQSPALYLQLLPLLGLFVAGYAQAGLYPGFGVGPVETLRRVVYVTTFGFLTLAAVTFALKMPPLYSRVTFVIAFAASPLLVLIGRVFVFKIADAWSWWSEPVVIIGAGRRAQEAIRNMHRDSHLGYRPSAILAVRGQSAAAAIDDVPVVGDIDRAASLARRGIRVALVAADQTLDRAALDRLQQHFRHVVLLREYDELPVEGLQVRNLGAVVGIEYTNNLLLHHNRVAKRSLDLLVGGVALLLATPVLLAAMLLVRLVSRGPALFSHRRAGLGGRPFAVPKIRTMTLDAEKRLEETLAADPGLRLEWEARQKLRGDPRLIPVVGRTLRRFSIDELPQLWSVVTGDMSLVGPRPFPDYHLAKFSEEFLELRQRVRPGITGLWQITIRSEGAIEDQEAYDTYYIRNWSVWLDIYILSRTIAAVLSGRGAY